MHRSEKSEAKPLVSIGLPVYNGQKYLQDAIDSALSQTYEHIELIISDNNSSDNTQDICVAYAAKDPRVRYFRQSDNIGIHDNFVFVTAKAKGRFFTWLAHDDVLTPAFIAEATKYLYAWPQIVLITGDFEIIGDDGREVSIEKIESIRPYVPWSARRIEFFKYPISHVYFCIYGVVRLDICKHALSTVPKPKIMGGAEAPILARISILGEICSVEGVWRKYRRHLTSVSMSEFDAMSRQSLTANVLARAQDRCHRRRDQLKVLMTSRLSKGEKFNIAVRMFSWYGLTLLRRIKRAAIRLVRTGSPLAK